MTSELVQGGLRRYALKPTVMLVVAGLVGLGALYLIAGRVERLISHWPQSTQATLSPVHCAQFIALAKAAYGDTWKSRLDPSDTTCATEVQQAWEQQRISRDAEAQLVRQPTLPAATEPAPPPVAESPAATAPRAQTYCLNVISLAKAKYGADWVSKLDPTARATCDSQITKP